MGDIPSRGSGLGSSSTVTVGLLHALWAHRGVLPPRHRLAETACDIEIKRLDRPIGKQDQYAVAFGGLRYIRFEPDSVDVSEPVVSSRTLRGISERLMLFYTGITRRSATILQEQRENTHAQRQSLRRMRDLADAGRAALADGQIDALGAYLHDGWMYKRELASRITNADIDGMYERARQAGALGGKICGAGGGGFLLLYAEPEAQDLVRAALTDYRELPFGLAPHGTRVLLNVDAGSDGMAEVG
jgi:D-glycero-alpha-D-manno-heptose-7-phosphate kinase